MCIIVEIKVDLGHCVLQGAISLPTYLALDFGTRHWAIKNHQAIETMTAQSQRVKLNHAM